MPGGQITRRVAVFGLGYVGIVSAACLASRGHSVTGVDVSPEKVDMVNQGRSTVVEERIGDLIAEQVAAGRLNATTESARAVADTDIALLCVGTPSAPNGSLATAYLERVSEEIGAARKTLSSSARAAVSSSARVRPSRAAACAISACARRGPKSFAASRTSRAKAPASL